MSEVLEVEAEDAGPDLTQLVRVDQSNALDVFAAPDNAKIDEILDLVRQRVEAFEVDASTPEGRKAAKAFARSISSSKTALEDVGKELAAAQKKIPKMIDDRRRHMKETLDGWRDMIRKPVEDWEAEEKGRQDAIKARLELFQSEIDGSSDRPSQEMVAILDTIQSQAITPEVYAEYVDAASELKADAITALTANIAAAKKREADAAELAELRAEKEKREALEREADEAAERESEIKRASEAAVQAEREAAAARERQLIADREAADKRAADAKAEAEREAERQREQERAAQAEREKNVAHRASVNRAALTALVEAGIDESVGKKVITLIVAGDVPHVSIRY